MMFRFILPLFLLPFFSSALTTEEWLERIELNTTQTAYNTSRTDMHTKEVATNLAVSARQDSLHYRLVDNALTNQLPFYNTYMPPGERIYGAQAVYNMTMEQDSLQDDYDGILSEASNNVGYVEIPDIPALNEDDVDELEISVPEITGDYVSSFQVIDSSTAQQLSALFGVPGVVPAMDLDFNTPAVQDWLPRINLVFRRLWQFFSAGACIFVVWDWWVRLRSFVFALMGVPSSEEPSNSGSFRI